MVMSSSVWYESELICRLAVSYSEKLCSQWTVEGWILINSPDFFAVQIVFFDPFCGSNGSKSKVIERQVLKKGKNQHKLRNSIIFILSMNITFCSCNFLKSLYSWCIVCFNSCCFLCSSFHSLFLCFTWNLQYQSKGVHGVLSSIVFLPFSQFAFPYKLQKLYKKKLVAKRKTKCQHTETK